MLAVSLRRLVSVGRSGRVGNVGGALPFLLPWQQRATFVDVKIRWVRDRGLDHTVERENHLRPLHALKDLLLRGDPPPVSLPLASISERRKELGLPFRPIDFIRRYPNAFVEDLPPVPSSRPPSSSSPTSSTPTPPAGDPSKLQPRIRATEELVGIHKDEILAYESCRADAADRLLRLLMLTRKRALPLAVVDRLSWDIGLPPDYPRSLLPEFPDYFRIADEHLLELVCWNKDLALSAMEQSAPKGFKSGMALAFPLQFSKGFELTKKVKKWMDEWQKLPYFSPYTDLSTIDPSSALGEKWAVSVLHELLHLLVPNKTEKENLLLLSIHAGLKRPFVKKILDNYSGIFYISNRNSLHTVILRDAYRRGALVKSHRLMELRYQYIHLMHKRPEKVGAGAGKRKKKGRKNAARAAVGKEDDEELEEEETEGEWDESSDYESEESSDEDLVEVCDGGNVMALGQTSIEALEDNSSLPSTLPTAGPNTVKSSQGEKTKLQGVSKNIGTRKELPSTKVREADNQLQLHKITRQLKTVKVHRGPNKKKISSGQLGGQATIGS